MIPGNTEKQIHQASCWNSCVLVWQKFNVSKALGKMVSGQRILRIIDGQRLCSVQPSLVTRSVSCYLKIHFSVWFGLNIAFENYSHSQGSQDSPYNLNKSGMFESINKCTCVHTPVSCTWNILGESSTKSLRITKKQQEEFFRGQGEGGRPAPCEMSQTRLQDTGQGILWGRFWNTMDSLVIFQRLIFLELF